MEVEGVMLNDTVQALSRMIQDLEKQLEHILEINEALERDLEREKKNTASAIQERNRLNEQLMHRESELSALEDSRAELIHMSHERSRLASTIEELGNQAAETERENRTLSQLVDRMQAERDHALEELQSVETQFERAMEIAGDLRGRMTALSEERESLVKRLKVVETRLKDREDQCNFLRAEVEESKQALEEIRHQIASTCLTPMWSATQEGESEK